MNHFVENTIWRKMLRGKIKLSPRGNIHYQMLKTTDYKHFSVVYPDGQEFAFEGAPYAHRALPGDMVQVSGSVQKVIQRAKHLPLVGVVELKSKIRFGMTSRNVPIYKFIPYDQSYPPFFVGCSQKDLTTNIIARIEFMNWDTGTCPRGNIIDIIGPCGNPEAEERALIMDACREKWLKSDTERLVKPIHVGMLLDAETFHIDPPGCRDIDDAISIIPDMDGFNIKIHIADVAGWIMVNPSLKKAARFGQSYYLDGAAVKPMFPKELSEDLLSLIPGKERQTVTFTFFWNPVTKTAYLDEGHWSIEVIVVRDSYTYETAYQSKYATILSELSSSLAGKPITDSHEWIEQLMLTYNTQAAAMLKVLGTGVLRRHLGKDIERFEKLQALGLPAEIYANHAGEYCSPFEENTTHCGLNRSAYCHASSPIRRWADCINQLALRDIIDRGDTALEENIITNLNSMSRRAKQFEREVIFMRALLTQKGGLEAVIVEIQEEKVKLWVPAWNRIVSSKHMGPGKPGDKVEIKFFIDPTQTSWKRRMVIRWAGQSNAASENLTPPVE